MAHYRPIHKYCLLYYPLPGPLISREIYSSPLQPAIVFRLFLFFTARPLDDGSQVVTTTRSPHEDDGPSAFVPFRVETGPEEHQVTAATQRGEMQSGSIEQSYKWWQSALWLEWALLDLDLVLRARSRVTLVHLHLASILSSQRCKIHKAGTLQT